MKAITTITLAIFCLAAQTMLSVEAAGWDPNQSGKRLKKVQETVQTFKKKDPGLKRFFEKAYGYAVFPTIIKGAVGFGGAYGKGQVFQRGTLIGSASLSQGTIGFQLGGQSYSEIIFFEDKVAFERFKRNRLEFAAQASAIAAEAGASAKAAYSKSVAVFTLAKRGLMYEASIGGQAFKFVANK